MKEKINFLLNEMNSFHSNDPRYSYFYDMVEYLLMVNYNETITYIKSIERIEYFEIIHTRFDELAIHLRNRGFIDIIKIKAQYFRNSKYIENILRSIKEAEKSLSYMEKEENYSSYFYFFDIKRIVNHLLFVILQTEMSDSYKKMFPVLLEDMLKLNCDTTIEYIKSMDKAENFAFLASYFEAISAHFKRNDFIDTIENKHVELNTNFNENISMKIKKAAKVIDEEIK